MKQEIKTALEKSVPIQRYYYSFGSTLLNQMVGGGVGFGIPGGKILNIVADKSAGKSFLACELIASSFHKDPEMKWVYDDCESGFTFDTKSLYGVEIMPLERENRVRSKTVEELYCNIRKFISGLKDGEKGIYVVDSLDGLSSDELDNRADARYKSFEKGERFDKGSYQMGKPKFLSEEFFRPIAEMIDRTNCLLVIISQVRQNVDPMSFEKWKRSGGKALDFYCHTVLWLATLSKIEKKERAIGTVVKAKTTKSKTPRPFRECVFSLLFSYGLDNVGSNVDYLFEYRTPNGKVSKEATAVWSGVPISASTLKEFAETRGVKVTGLKAEIQKTLKEQFPEEFNSYFGEPKTRDEMIEYVEANELQQELAKRVLEKWEEIEKSIIPERKARVWV